MLQDILDFAVVMLVPNGRLSMWMPIANEDNVELTIPTSPGLELVSVCVQHFNKCTSGLTDLIIDVADCCNRGTQIDDLQSFAECQSGRRSRS